MPQVSKRRLSKDIEEKMFALLFQAFARLSKSSEIQKFLEDLLGPVEKTMIAKRLAIALLLARGYDYESVKKTLCVSSETVARVNLSLHHSHGGYKIVVDKILQDRTMSEFWDKIENMLLIVYPTASGVGRMLRRKKRERTPQGPLG